MERRPHSVLSSLLFSFFVSVSVHNSHAALAAVRQIHLLCKIDVGACRALPCQALVL